VSLETVVGNFIIENNSIGVVLEEGVTVVLTIVNAFGSFIEISVNLNVRGLSENQKISISLAIRSNMETATIGIKTFTFTVVT